MMTNYFTWREAVIDAATKMGVKADTVEKQQSEVYQHMYFDEQLSAEQAAKYLVDLETPPNK